MRFELKALKGRQGLEALTLDARDADDAIRQAAAQGYTVLSARRSFSLRTLLPQSSSALPLALFSQELVALLEAGLNLVEALETLAEKEERAEARKIIRGLLGELYEGRSFSHALGAFPHVFTPLYIATVLASERTGDLPEAMARFVAYQAQLDVVRKKLVAASVYPALLILVGGRRDDVPAGLRRAAFQPHIRRHGERTAAAVPVAAALGPAHRIERHHGADRRGDRRRGRGGARTGACRPAVGGRPGVAIAGGGTRAGGCISWRASIARSACCCAAARRSSRPST